LFIENSNGLSVSGRTRRKKKGDEDSYELDNVLVRFIFSPLTYD